MSKQTKYDWNIPDDGMRAEKGFYPTGDLHNVFDNPGNNTKANVSMKAEKGTYPKGRFHSDWNNPENNIKLKDDMKVWKGIDHAKKLHIRSKCSGEENLFL